MVVDGINEVDDFNKLVVVFKERIALLSVAEVGA